MTIKKVLGYSDGIAKLNVEYDELVKSINETGIYHNVATGDWELWYVNGNDKRCIGLAAPSLRTDTMDLLWRDFVLFEQTAITSIYDLSHGVTIQ